MALPSAEEMTQPLSLFPHGKRRSTTANSSSAPYASTSQKVGQLLSTISGALCPMCWGIIATVTFLVIGLLLMTSLAFAILLLRD